jgi:hypothetical protein
MELEGTRNLLGLGILFRLFSRWDRQASAGSRFGMTTFSNVNHQWTAEMSVKPLSVM